MRILSFAYTTPPLVAGAKTVTRREWDDEYAAQFRAGQLVAAYDRSPRFRGRQVAVIRLTAAPTYEPNAAMPDSDYAAEGFEWLHAHPEALPKTLWGKPCTLDDFSRDGFERWRRNGGSMWVVRFELVQVLAPQPAAMVQQPRLEGLVPA